MNKDLTVGNPSRVLWQFCLPLFGSIIFQQLYNIADSLVAGKYVGEITLAAVGNSYEVTLIFIAFAFGCNVGCSFVVLQLFGTKDYGQMKTAVTTVWISCAILCLALMAAGIGFCGAMLNMLHTPKEVFSESKLYLEIYILGLPFMFFCNIFTSIFSVLGDSKTPFVFLAASSISNIFLDIFFVTAFQMGVAGVAWATFLCQGVSCVLSVPVVLKRLKAISIHGYTHLFSIPIFKRFAIIAIPSILQQSFISVGNIIIQGVINGFGTGVMAGYSAGVKLNNLVITSFTTLGNGISNFTAQNIGAGIQSRVKEGFKAGLKLVWLLSLLLFLTYFFAGEQLLYLFLEEPTELAVHTGVAYLRILSPFYFVISVKLVADGVLKGASRMKEFLIGTFSDLILRTVPAILLAKTSLGATGIWYAWPIG